MNIKVKKLHKNAVMPFRAHSTDAGVDLVAVSVKLEGNKVIYETGLAFELPENHFGFITNRSSIKDYDLIINAGVADTGFRGGLKVSFTRFGDKIYNVGDRVAQLVIVPCVLANFNEVYELSESDRGTGGFGSTGK